MSPLTPHTQEAHLLVAKTIALVPLERKHLDKALEWANDPALMPDILRVLPVCRDNIVADASKLVFAILHGDDGLHIGNTGLYQIDTIHRRAEFWILIGDQTHQGRGVGAEATALMRRFAFDHLNLHRLYLHVGSANSRARALYARQGFVEEGVLREHYYIDGSYRDVIAMSQLKREYDQQKRSE
jgi:diamine N-acetyltransferase